ncbi:MAG: ABC transporter ATP-binding protein, partial [Fusobacteriaceae bacterium]|nr:ABC transporter ATP-binding protein [Fusobacteriaceae bacterium]
MLKLFLQYYKPYKKMFLLDLFVAMVASVCGLVYPMMTREIINNVLPARNYRMFMIFAAALIAIYLIRMFCNYFMQYWGHLVGVGMQADMRRDVYEHLQELPVRYFDSNQTGTIMSRIVNDLQEVSELAHHGPEDLFISFIMLFGSFVILLRINVALTLILFVFFPLIVFF